MISVHRSRLALIVSAIALVFASFWPQAAQAGFGGVEARIFQSYGCSDCGYNLGTTNTLSQTNEAYFSGSLNTCTHAYPNNDVYKDFALGFQTFTFSGSNANSNCNRVVLYPGNQEQGAGAVNCYRSSGSCTPGGTFYSISWHNR